METVEKEPMCVACPFHQVGLVQLVLPVKAKDVGRAGRAPKLQTKIVMLTPHSTAVLMIRIARVKEAGAAKS